MTFKAKSVYANASAQSSGGHDAVKSIVRISHNELRWLLSAMEFSCGVYGAAGKMQLASNFEGCCCMEQNYVTGLVVCRGPVVA